MSTVGGPMWKISAALTSPQICALETILHCPWTSTTTRLRLKWRKPAQWKMWKIVRADFDRRRHRPVRAGAALLPLPMFYASGMEQY
jgi:hypothetical protein